MSNITLFSDNTVPAFARQNASALTKSLAGGSGGFGKRVSIKGGVFRLMVDGQQVAAIEERFLDVVIVNAAAKISRTFYVNAYDPESPAAPDCWSPDGERPDPTAATPQSDRCATCPQNAKGSGKGDSRACRFNQRLAVVLANDVDGDVMQLQLPAASIFGRAEGENMPLQAYARLLATKNVGVDTLVTRMKFDTQSESPKLFFKPMRWLTEDEYASAQEQGRSPSAVEAVTMTVAQVDKTALDMPGGPPGKQQKPAEDAEPPAPAPRRGRPPKAAAPAEEEPEPEVKRPAPAPAPAGKASLAELAQQWDDE